MKDFNQVLSSIQDTLLAWMLIVSVQFLVILKEFLFFILELLVAWSNLVEMYHGKGLAAGRGKMAHRHLDRFTKSLLLT